MAKKQRRFADDGWAIWIDGDDTSTIHINDWINPTGKSYVDIAIHTREVKLCKSLNVYVPFSVSDEEIEDVSLSLWDTKILQALFSAACIVDYKKNPYTSEIAYNGKTVDVVHISAVGFQSEALFSGTLIRVDLQKLQPYIANDEVYFIWRMPHKSLDAIFESRVDMEKAIVRLRDLVTTPVVSEKYGYSVRINESRLLPEEITRIGVFHRQKLKKAVITISLDEKYELNDSNCYRIRRLEKNLYKDFLPDGYPCDDVITYQWNQSREDNLRGQFNFYYSITKNTVSHGSMFLYIMLLLVVGVLGNVLAALVMKLFSRFM
jgi:hypothetical protein